MRNLKGSSDQKDKQASDSAIKKEATKEEVAKVISEEVKVAENKDLDVKVIESEVKVELGQDQNVRVSTKSETRGVIAKIISMFMKMKSLKVTVTGLGNAISKTAKVAEILSFRIPDLKVEMATSKLEIKRSVAVEGSDESKEEIHVVPCMTIVLSVDSPVEALKESKKSKLIISKIF